jgi:predicted nucleic acid-binding protein
LIPRSSITTTLSWTRKELLAKGGLSESERQEIESLLGRFRMIAVDDSIAERYWELLKKYESQGLRQADAIIAATAWHKGVPLLTRNQKHFRFISEIELAPVYRS